MSNILYIDTESEQDSKKPISIQWRINGAHGILTDFNFTDYEFIRALWFRADAVIMFNAPYDIGVLSSAFPQNTWRWIKQKDGGYWDIEIFSHHYKVRRIGGHRNLIKPFGVFRSEDGIPFQKKDKKPKSTVIIDLLKLWSILVDDGRNHSIGLKSLIQRELGKTPIPYSLQNARTPEYQYQDVDLLEELWQKFLIRVSNIADVRNYSYAQWGYIKTPATFTKIAYQERYPGLRKMQRYNFLADEKHQLTNPLESAYHGGLTIALRRGHIDQSAWFDIHGAYAHCIEYMETDRFLQYHWEEINILSPDISDVDTPILCQVETTAILTSINKSLKIFTIKKPKKMWLWNSDILALQIIFPDETYNIIQAYKPIPENKITHSLPKKWSKLKEEEQKINGKTTLRDYYKFMSNTSYGIKAQRHPYITVHTNMVIAGMITARVHYVLLSMMDEARIHGLEWEYSDTDSICMSYTMKFNTDIEAALNKRIYPYTCECEGYNFVTKILSLKRYVSEKGILLSGKKATDKIKLHGKSRYKITKKIIYNGVMQGITSNKPIIVSQLAANTEISMKQLYNAVPFCRKYIHPFAFHTNIPSDKTLTEWFHDWKSHIDTKTTYPPHAKINDEFKREFWQFDTYYQGVKFFGGKIAEGDEPEDYISDNFTNWDKEIQYLFNV